MVTPVQTTTSAAAAPPNLVMSLIRTWVPIIVGALISWLTNLGLHVNDELRGGMTILLTALFIGVYYTVVRVLERQFPALGMLLGTARQPLYTVQPPTVESTAPTATGVQPVYPPDSTL
jgi:hypothetical protein